MIEINASQANKIIADYMNCIIVGYTEQHGSGLLVEAGIVNQDGEYLSELYSSSLDALVPVWEKLNKDYHAYHFDIGIYETGRRQVDITFENLGESLDEAIMRSKFSDSETIQESAAIATAKVIKEMNIN